MKIFNQYPFFGGGSAVLRGDRGADGSMSVAAKIARKADMGYTHWLKHYGIVGMAWLALFYIALWVYVQKLGRELDQKYMAIAAFGNCFLVFFVISFLTLNHLMFTDTIAMVCLVCAILVRSLQLVNENTVVDEQ